MNVALEHIKTKLVKILKINPSHIVCISINPEIRPYVTDFEGRLISGTNPIVVSGMIKNNELVFIGENWLRAKQYRLENYNLTDN